MPIIKLIITCTVGLIVFGAGLYYDSRTAMLLGIGILFVQSVEASQWDSYIAWVVAMIHRTYDGRYPCGFALRKLTIVAKELNEVDIEKLYIMAVAFRWSEETAAFVHQIE